MVSLATYPLPGIYQYTYPTFADKPQRICVHFITPDGQQAFVTYPGHPYPKAAQLISLGWFNSVTLVKLAGASSLMTLLEKLFTNPIEIKQPALRLDRKAAVAFKQYDSVNQLVA